MAAANRGVIEEQNLQKMIHNLYYTRDGKSGYAMYYTFELPIVYPEFSSRSRNVLVDCSNMVLEARAQTIEDDELAQTAQIVQLEEDVIEDSIRALNTKQEVLESLREDLIAYKARCGRYRACIERRRAEVETRRAIEAQNARELEEAASAQANAIQNEPMDLSRSAREEELRQHIERQHNLPVVRLQRFDQQRPQIVIRRCDAPIRQPDPVLEPPVIMAQQQPLNEANEEPEVEAAPEQQEEVMDVEVYDEDDEITDSDTDDDADEIENAIYDQAIQQMENAGNVQQNVQNWEEEVVEAEAIRDVEQQQPVNVQPEIVPVQNVQMQPLPMEPIGQLRWNNTRFGLEALDILREYGRDIIIRVRVNENRPEKAMVHLSTDIDINVVGERVVSQWGGVFTYLAGTRTNALPDIYCQLDGAPFIYNGLKRRYRVTLFPYIDSQDDAIIATAYLVPPLGHTPDFSLERIVFGNDFLREHIHSINPGLMEITLRAENDRLVRKRYQLRQRMRV